MKWKRHGDEQIVYALRQTEGGEKVAEICRKLGISEQTFYRWKRKYWGVGVTELRELRHFRQENQKLKRLVADLFFRQAHPAGGALKKGLKPTQRQLDYNQQRSHSSLKDQTPETFALAGEGN